MTLERTKDFIFLFQPKIIGERKCGERRGKKEKGTRAYHIIHEKSGHLVRFPEEEAFWRREAEFTYYL